MYSIFGNRRYKVAIITLGQSHTWWMDHSLYNQMKYYLDPILKCKVITTSGAMPTTVSVINYKNIIHNDLLTSLIVLK